MHPSLILVYSLLSYLNPLNWGKDISNAFLGKVESALLYILDLILNAILSASNAILASMMSSVNFILNEIAAASELLGPFSLPAFFIAVTLIFIALDLAIGFLHDTPVVGDFV